MNHCGIHQKNTTFASSSREETRSSLSVSVTFDNGVPMPMACPKPRRLSLFSNTVNEPLKPLRWQMCQQSEGYESKAGSELLDIIFANSDTCTQLASSPPFFSGSPPSRVSNPLTQDARFRGDPISPNPNPAPSGVSSSPKGGGCLLSNFGNKPAVRIEGFDCLDRDNRRNCSIPTLA